MTKQQLEYLQNRLDVLELEAKKAKEEGNQEKLKQLAWSIAFVSDALYLD